MKKRYFLDFVSLSAFNGVGKYNATSKARNDVTTIINEFNPIYKPIYRHFNNKLLGVAEVLFQIYCQLIRIPKGSQIFIQYPIINLKPFLFVACFFRRFDTIAIVHDLQSYRYPMKNSVIDEVRVLNSFNYVIVHSEAMFDKLKRTGVESKMYILNCFDYLLPDEQVAKEKKDTIVYAGTLDKSHFLEKLNTINLENINFNLYGKPKPPMKYCERIQYKGAFLPDDISMIEGEWGLLWDGDSIDTCGGNFGEYLQLIAPHKFSLYLACGLKIICWEYSAMASLVKKYNIGVVISSLKDLNNIVTSISECQKEEMNENVRNIKTTIRQGGMLRSILCDIIDD